MKKIAILSMATVLVAALVASASAADRVVPVSKSTLASMGFGGVSLMSDSDGLAVRGKGFWSHSPAVTTTAQVSGSSTANFHGWSGDSTSSNQYAAGSSHTDGGAAGATGSSLSFAGKVSGAAVGGDGGLAFQIHGTVIFAGGTASASAH
jgi:hypothetical protein